MLWANDLRNGTVFKYEGKIWIVINYEFIKMGRGSGTVKVKARDLMTGATVEKGFSQQMRFEEVNVSKKTVQYLYHDESYGYFMDNETYEQYQLDYERVKESLMFVPEGERVIMIFVEGNPLNIEIPKSVNLKVTYTEPAVKGDTSSGAMKKAELETGLEIQVPLFINIGDVIKVNTDDVTYSERISKAN